MSERVEYLLGLDEVGLGSCAGPASFCGVLGPKDSPFLLKLATEGVIKDSKKIKVKSRMERARTEIEKVSKLADHGFFLVHSSPQEIDEIGLASAIKKSFLEIITHFASFQPQVILDGRIKIPNLPSGIQVLNMDKADSKIPHVMAAACYAKATRDQIMTELAIQYPGYEWHKNVGYPSPAHKAGIRKHGFTPYHRTSYDIKL